MGLAKEWINYCADMTWDNFIKVWAALWYPVVGPYIVTAAAPKAIEIYYMYREDLDYIGYTPKEIFEYIMLLSYDSYVNAMDIFYDNGTPLVPEMPEIKRPF